MAYNEHLKGAVVLTGLRGREQLKSDVGLSLYHRMRGMIVSSSDSIPSCQYISAHHPHPIPSHTAPSQDHPDLSNSPR
jgi:hypothetical protein